MITAEELIIKQYGDIWERRSEIQKSKISKERYINLFGLSKIDGVEPSTKELMIEFAKLHVEAALKEASEKVEADLEPMDWLAEQHLSSPFIEGEDYAIGICRNSILEAYPLSKIL